MSSPTYSEKSQTEWFYSIRGDATRRGLVNEVVLFRMATEGHLQPTDLIWNKATGTQWILASSIPDLFFNRPPDPKPQVVQVAPDNIPISKRHRSSLPVLLVLGVLLIYPTSWFSQKLYLEEVKLPAAVARWLGLEYVPEGLPDITLHCNLIDLHLKNEHLDKAKAMIIELTKHDRYRNEVDLYTERLQATQQKIARREELAKSVAMASRHLDEERLEEAEALIANIKTSDEYKARADELTVRAAALKAELARRKNLEDVLRQGKYTQDSLKQLLAVYEKKNRQVDLINLTENILQGRKALPPRACLGVAQLYMIMNKTTHAKVALEHFTARAEGLGQQADFLEAAQMFRAMEDPTKAVDLLEKHVEKSPNSTLAWMEIAAFRAQSGDSKNSLEALTNAFKQDDPKIRDSVIKDQRFDSIRDSRGYRRLIKTE